MHEMRLDRRMQRMHVAFVPSLDDQPQRPFQGYHGQGLEGRVEREAAQGSFLHPRERWILPDHPGFDQAGRFRYTILPPSTVSTTSLEAAWTAVRSGSA